MNKKINVSKILKKLSKEKIDIIYFADSLGCMSIKDVKEIIHLFKKIAMLKSVFMHMIIWVKQNNNVSAAIKNNCNWIDTTVLGMGRGAGNAKTEDFVTKIIEKLN